MPAYRFAPILLALAVWAAPLAMADAAGRRLPRPHSWGKPGISYLQYRTDTVECGYVAAQAELKMGASGYVSPGPRLDASGQDDDLDTLIAASEAYRQETLMLKAKAVDQLQAVLEGCLRERGYRPFKLTPEQAGRLKALKTGGPNRGLYLYSLAVDPKVLAAQGL